MKAVQSHKGKARIKAFFPQSGGQGAALESPQVPPFLNQSGVPGLFGPQAATPATPKKGGGIGSIFSTIDKSVRRS